MKTDKNIFSIFLLFCLVFFFVPANGQYLLKSSVFSNGGQRVSDMSEYILLGNVGQSFTGFSENSSHFLYSGFIYHPYTLLTGIEDISDLLPKKFQLYQNYPNPFNPATNIKFALPKSVDVKIVIYNLLGQQVCILLNEKRLAGYHTIAFNAEQLPSGLYFYTIQTDFFNQVKKMMLIK